MAKKTSEKRKHTEHGDDDHRPPTTVCTAEATQAPPPPMRTFEQESAYLEKLNEFSYKIHPGFVPNMRIPGMFFVNSQLEELVMDELREYSLAGGVGGFTPAVKQIANVASL